MLTLVLGGARSGKTAHALSLAAVTGLAPVYVATAAAGDAEMAARIARHRAERGPDWTTVEEEIDLPRRIVLESRAERVLLVDCLTLWLSNLIFAELDPEAMAAALLQAVKRAGGPLIFISNEVGLGIVPENALARRFRDAQGRLNQQVAAAADRVVFVAAGLPLVLKEAAPAQA